MRRRLVSPAIVLVAATLLVGCGPIEGYRLVCSEERGYEDESYREEFQPSVSEWHGEVWTVRAVDATVIDDVVIAAQDCNVLGIGLETGRLLWWVPMEFPRSVAKAGETAVAAADDRQVRLDPQSGEILDEWTVGGGTARVVAEGSLVVIHTEDEIAAINTAGNDDERVWEAPWRDARVPKGPAGVLQDGMLFVRRGSVLTAVDTHEQSVRWTVEIDDTGLDPPTRIAVSDRHLWACSNTRASPGEPEPAQVIRIAVETGAFAHARLESQDGTGCGRTSPAPLVTGNVVVVPILDSVVGLDKDSMDVSWTLPTASWPPGKALAGVSGAQLVVVDDKVAVYDPVTGTELARAQRVTGSEVVNPVDLVLAGRFAMVRQSESLAVVDLDEYLGPNAPG